MSKRRDQDALDQHLQRIGLALYGAVPQVHRFRSENSDVCRFHFDCHLTDKVVKYARANAPQVLREQTVLRLLARAGLPVPAVEFTQEDCPFATAPFFTMPHLGGSSLQQACESRVPWASVALVRAGQFLARLGTLSPQLLLGSEGTARAPLQRPPIARCPPSVEEWALYTYLPPEQLDLVASHLRTIAGLLGETRDLVHGSYSPAHILCDAGGAFAVIDWENATAGSVLHDVGHFLAAVEVWSGGDPGHARSFLDGFVSERPLDAAHSQAIGEWALYTSLVWANFFAAQGQRETAERVLQVARRYLSTDPRLPDH
jgi:aminoglycoside phosphotransferase (APT) family kinase protein